MAPGGLVTYTCVLTNSSVQQVHGMAVFVVPDGMRYAAAYPATPKKVNGVVNVKTGKAYTPKPVLNFGPGGGNPQLIIDAGILYPVSDSKHRNTVSFDVTFQAQWIDPTVTPQLATINYGAAFFTHGSAQDKSFIAALDAAKETTADAAGATDFLTYIDNYANNLDASKNDSGVVTVALRGSLANQPLLDVGKVVSNKVTETTDDGSGGSLNAVTPGDLVTFDVFSGQRGPVPG